MKEILFDHHMSVGYSGQAGGQRLMTTKNRGSQNLIGTDSLSYRMPEVFRFFTHPECSSVDRATAF
jgi:hypothetical protein